MHSPWRRPALSAVLLAALCMPAAPAAAATVTVSVPNGITTADLSSVGMTKEALANALVGTNPNITIKPGSVTSVGQSFQLGTVHVLDPTVVSFNDGVILSSGDVANIVGPNKSDSITGVGLGNSDAQLTDLISATQTVNPMTYDAASLEFDFTPTASPVYFTYVFGSDEYLEWVNLFNDVFGFFVTDNSGTTTNCAMTPTGHTISIDTINDNVNAGLYRDNSFSAPPAAPLNIEADGLSVELICQAPVTPNAVNHMKIAIADTSDQVLDSWVMLKSGSLSTTQPESCNDGVDDDNDTYIDMSDSDCSATTTAPPTGASGVGANSTPPAFTGSAGQSVTLDASIFNVDLNALDAVEPPDNVIWSLVGINGNAGTCTIDEAQPMAYDGVDVPTATATCTDPGEYQAKLDARFGTDSKGDWDIDFFVQDAPPTVDLTAPVQGASFASGAQVDVSLTISDLTNGETATCSVDWGVGAVVEGAVSGNVCTASHTYVADGQYVVSATAKDSAGNAAAKAVVVSVGKSSQEITVTTAPPTSARYGTSFTVDATGGASTMPVVFESSGSCTNAGATYTVTVSTGACTVTISQAGDSTYFAASPQSFDVNADLGAQSRISVKSSLAKGKSLTIPRATAQGGVLTVKVSGACTLVRNYKGSGKHKTLRNYSVKGTKARKNCYVTLKAAAVANYEALAQYKVTVKVK